MSLHIAMCSDTYCTTLHIFSLSLATLTNTQQIEVMEFKLYSARLNSGYGTKIPHSLCLNSVSKVCLLQELTITKLYSLIITRLHHLVGFSNILQKSAVCYLVPVGVHTSLPQYPPGVPQ